MTKDAELRVTPEGQKVLNFTLATDIGYGDHKVTEYIQCSMWGDRGERITEYLTKGRQLFVMGDGSFRAWTKGSKSGVNYCCAVDNLEFGSLPKGQVEEENQAARAAFPPEG